MQNITIISGTNRPNSNTLKVSNIYKAALEKSGHNVELLDLTTLPQTIAFTELYGKRSNEFTGLISKYVTNTHKFIFVVPEYNGSYPGILKVLLDSIHPKEWSHKKALLVGVSSGRAGNLRGLDHLTGVLNYLKVFVHHNRLPISLIDKLLTENSLSFNDEAQQKVIEDQLTGFYEF
jgi:chromate reductase, NAD(P)H dehydrogenase (quinone)